MSRPSRGVSPMFAWTAAVLSSGDMVLDAMRTAVRNARGVRVAVLPQQTKAKARPKPSARRAKPKRRR